MKLYTEAIMFLSKTVQYLFALSHLFLNSPRMWVPNHTLHVIKPVFTRPRCFTKAIVYIFSCTLAHLTAFAPPPPPSQFNCFITMLCRNWHLFFSLNGEFAFKRGNNPGKKVCSLDRILEAGGGKYRSALRQMFLDINWPWTK
jgi:hypothetical protein